MTQPNDADLLGMTATIVAAFVGNNKVSVADLPKLIKATHETVSGLADSALAAAAPEPAVPVSKSIQTDYLICLEDGRKLKMLKRYLRSRYDMSPEDYRKRWNLPASYPMVAPSYAKLRSKHAKEIGLGRSKKSEKSKVLVDAD